jgi:dihydrofolate reductase
VLRSGRKVAALTARTSRDLILYGCGELANYLARQHLVDEVRFWMHPYVWGRGVRPFEPGEMPMPLRLLSTKTYTSGLVRLTYEPAG